MRVKCLRSNGHRSMWLSSAKYHELQPVFNTVGPIASATSSAKRLVASSVTSTVVISPSPTMTIRGSRFPGMAGWWVWVISVVHLCLPKPARQELRSVPVFVVLQELLGVVVGVGPGLAVVEMRWWDPFGDAAVALAGGPALFGELVVRAAGQGQPVDVGGVGFRPGRDVVDFGEV